MASSINKQIPLYPLLLINFIGTLGFSIVLPFLVFLVIDFGGNAIIYGILAAIYPGRVRDVRHPASPPPPPVYRSTPPLPVTMWDRF